MLIFFLSLIEDEVDQTEFEQLYNRYSGDVRRVARSIIKNYHDAEDICQEIWLYVSQVIEQIRPDPEYGKKAYILKVAEHKSYDFLRGNARMSKYIEIIDAEEAEELQDMSDAVLAAVCRQETSEAIHQCLKSIKKSLREILIFYYLDNMKVTDIAQLMKLEISTVYRRLSIGRSLLAKMLIEKGINNDE